MKWKLLFRVQGLELSQCRPLINKPPPFKGLNIGNPIIVSIKGRGLINQGSTLAKNTRSFRLTSSGMDRGFSSRSLPIKKGNTCFVLSVRLKQTWSKCIEIPAPGRNSPQLPDP